MITLTIRIIYMNYIRVAAFQQLCTCTALYIYISRIDNQFRFTIQFMLYHFCTVSITNIYQNFD